MKKIRLALFLIIILLPVFGSAQDPEIEKYKGFVKNYTLQMRSIISYEIDHIRFGKSSAFTDAEHDYVDSIQNPENYASLKTSLNNIKERDLKNDKTVGITYVTYSDFRQSKDGKMNLKVLGYQYNHQIAPIVKTFSDEKIFTEDPSSNAWTIDNDISKDPTFAMYNPIDTFTSYRSTADANGRLYHNSIDSLIDKGESFSVSKSGDVVIFTVKIPQFLVNITIDEKNNAITKIQTIIDGKGLVEYVLEKNFSNFVNIDGIQFPKKVVYFGKVNGKIVDENIKVYDRISINKDVSIQISEDNIKDGALVEDFRVNFTYKKGHPEIRM